MSAAMKPCLKPARHPGRCRNADRESWELVTGPCLDNAETYPCDVCGEPVDTADAVHLRTGPEWADNAYLCGPCSEREYL